MSVVTHYLIPNTVGGTTLMGVSGCPIHDLCAPKETWGVLVELAASLCSDGQLYFRDEDINGFASRLTERLNDLVIDGLRFGGKVQTKPVALSRGNVTGPVLRILGSLFLTDSPTGQVSVAYGSTALSSK